MTNDLPFQLVLTDRGSCFIADALEAACKRYGAPHRKSRACAVKANSTVKHFDSRVQCAGPGITLYGRADLKIVLRSYTRAITAASSAAPTGSRTRVLRRRLEVDPALANPAGKTVQFQAQQTRPSHHRRRQVPTSRQQNDQAGLLRLFCSRSVSAPGRPSPIALANAERCSA